MVQEADFLMNLKLIKKSKLTICISIALERLKKTKNKLFRQRNILIHLANSLMKNFPISHQAITGVKKHTKITALICIDPPNGKENNH